MGVFKTIEDEWDGRELSKTRGVALTPNPQQGKKAPFFRGYKPKFYFRKVVQ